MPREASPGKLDAFEEELFRNADMADAPPVAAVLLGTSDGQALNPPVCILFPSKSTK